jgi:hypothetical protein
MTGTTSDTRRALPPWLPPALLLAGILLCRVLAARLQGMALHLFLHSIPAIALFYLLYRSYGIRRIRGTGRAALFLLLGALSVLLFVAQQENAEMVQVALYFLLGAACYKARGALGGHTGLRCYLDIFIVLMLAVFLEEVVKGLSQVARYAPGVGHDNAMGMAGAFFARNLDFDRPYSFGKRRRKRRYEGAAPLLDIHLYWRDVVLVAVLAAVFLVQDAIGAFYRTDTLAGEWRIQGGSYPAFQLSSDGMVRCQAGEEGDWVTLRSWGIEGNLLDGFFLFMWPQRRTENVHCSFLNPWVEKKNRFRLRGDAAVFDNATSSWLWPVETLLRCRPGAEDAMQWERVR